MVAPPSLFSPESIFAIIKDAEEKIGFEPNIEITLEANPGTFEQEKFIAFYQAGINRLSIGIQSFQKQHLKKLGRIHNSDEAKAAIDMAKHAGFSNLNIDLMHGLPEQTQAQAISDLQTAIDFTPSHISWYQLTIEPNTLFFREKPPLPADDTLAAIQDAGQILLNQAGYEQYEVSAFCKAQQQAKHNINYWSFGDYIGIGAGAHGKITDANTQQIIRKQKTRLPEHYLHYSDAPKAKTVVVADEDLALEFMMNSLRLNQGVPKAWYAERTGLHLARLDEKFESLINKGLIEDNSDKLVTTSLGQQYLNSVLAAFMK